MFQGATSATSIKQVEVAEQLLNALTGIVTLTVSPICACDVVRTGEWMTAGGQCNTATCKTAYWSGAPMDAFSDGTDFLMKNLNLKKSPVNWCPQTASK